MDYRFESLQVNVLEWAKDKDLLKPENANQQFLKVIEEVGELASGIAKKDEAETIDAMGDTLVTLIILSEQLGLDPVECLREAYEVIKNRTGKTINGTFIKND